MMSKILRSLLLLLAVLQFVPVSAEPRILFSTSSPAPDSQVTLTVKKDAPARYKLQVDKPNQAAMIFQLVKRADAGGDSTLSFVSVEEEKKATAILAAVNDSFLAGKKMYAGKEYTGLSDFINSIYEHDRQEGVTIVYYTMRNAPAEQGPAWPMFAIVAVIAAAAGYALHLVVQKAMTGPEAQPAVVAAVAAPAEPAEGATGTKTATPKQMEKQTAQLEKTIAALKDEHQVTRTEKNGLQQQAQQLRQQLDNTLKRLAAIEGLQQQLMEDNKQLAKDSQAMEQYFNEAHAELVLPFNNYITSNRISPADPVSQSYVLTAMLRMSWHYFSLVRYKCRVWDENDVYNVQQFGALAPQAKGTRPVPVTTEVKSGRPGIVLLIAGLIDQKVNEPVAVNIKGFEFTANNKSGS